MGQTYNFQWPRATLNHFATKTRSSDILADSSAHSHVTESSETDIRFMQLALEEAAKAARAEEVPIGAVLVSDGRVVAHGFNCTLTDTDPTAHAEIVVLRDAARKFGNHRLLGATMYVTVEPCAMCAGAVIQARIARLIYGAHDPKAGAVHTFFEILSHPSLNHRVEVVSGVCAEEAAALLRAFFSERR